eukprot:gene37903-12524_t
MREMGEDDAKRHDWPIDPSHLSQLELRELRDSVKVYQEKVESVIADTNLCVVCMTDQKAAVFLPHDPEWDRIQVV